MTTKHTPGPWRAIATKRDGTWPIWEIEANGDDLHPIAEVSDKANARLIAAAPDLLAACEMWLSGETMWSTTQAYEMAARAVAKAKGDDSGKA